MKPSNGDEAAREAFENDVGDLAAQGGHRLVKIMLTVPLPTVLELAAIANTEEPSGTAAVA